MATSDDIRRHPLHQHENGAGPSTINGAVSAPRFLFDVTLKRRDLSRALVITRYQRHLPDVLSIEEAARRSAAVSLAEAGNRKNRLVPSAVTFG